MTAPRLAALLALAALAPAPPAPASTAPIFDQLRSLFRSSLVQHRVAGASLLVLHNHQPVFEDFYGDANRATRAPVDRDTAFHWASITKTFTAVAILQLRDHGLLHLDDPAVRYLPELRQVHDPFGPIDNITVRHLLLHAAGFRGPTWPWTAEPSQPSSYDRSWEPFEPTRWSQVAALLPYTAVLFPPGSRHSYSNLGYVFLGQIIERLSGDDYEVFIDKNILKPLGMHASYFDRAPYFLLAHRAAGYEGSGDSVKPAPFNFDSGITVSNSGLNSPFPDMARYLDFLLGNPARAELYNQVLARSSLAEMFRPELAVPTTDPSQLPAPDSGDSIGLGFFLHPASGRVFIGHGGEQGGFVSHFYLDPASGFAYLIAFNTDISGPVDNTQTLDRELRDFLLTRVFPALARP